MHELEGATRLEAAELLEAFPAGEPAKLARTAQALAGRLGKRFTLYEDFDPVRFESTAWITVMENPARTIVQHERAAAVTLWIFSIDNVIDEGRWPEDRVRERLDHYKRLVRGRDQVDPADPFSLVMGETVTRLSQTTLYRSLGGRFNESVSAMLDGMVREAFGPHPATLPEYLDFARFTIGVPTYVLASWMLSVDVGELPDEDGLFTLLDAGARVIRLANDLRTAEKELREGNLNAVMLLPDGARGVRQALHAALGAFIPARIPPNPLAANLARLVALTVGLYARADFHSVSTAELWSGQS